MLGYCVQFWTINLEYLVYNVANISSFSMFSVEFPIPLSSLGCGVVQGLILHSKNSVANKIRNGKKAGHILSRSWNKSKDLLWPSYIIRRLHFL